MSKFEIIGSTYCVLSKNYGIFKKWKIILFKKRNVI